MCAFKNCFIQDSITMDLEAILGLLGLRLKYTLDEMAVYCRAANLHLGAIYRSQSTHWHVFGKREEIREPKDPPHRPMENI